MITRADVIGKLGFTIALVDFSDGYGHIYGVPGVERLRQFVRMYKRGKPQERVWQVDGETMPNLDVALAVINGTMTMDEGIRMATEDRVEKISIEQQIEELELRQREGRTSTGKNERESVTKFRGERFAAAVRTLRWLRDNEQSIREWGAARRAAQKGESNGDIGRDVSSDFGSDANGPAGDAGSDTPAHGNVGAGHGEERPS